MASEDTTHRAVKQVLRDLNQEEKEEFFYPNKVPPLTDEEITWLRQDKQRAEAYGIVWNSAKSIGGFILIILGAYWALWDFFVSLVNKAKEGM